MLRLSLGRSLAFAVVGVLALFLASDGLLAAPPGGGNGGGGGGGGGPKTGTIVGEVLGGSGPVGGASVLLFDGVAIDQVAETFTDSNGNFQFKKVKAGTYGITVVSLSPPCFGNATVTVVPKQLSIVIVVCQ